MERGSTLRRIAAHYIFYRRQLLPRPIVSVGPDGTILEVAFTDRPDAQAATEFYSGILVPGLVNAHCHLELSALRGAIPRAGGFAAFARAIGPARAAVGPSEAMRAAAAADAAMRAAGVAAVGDVCNSPLTFGLKIGAAQDDGKAGGSEGGAPSEAAAAEFGRACTSGGVAYPKEAAAGTPGRAGAGRGIEYTSFLELYGLGRTDASALLPLAEQAERAGLRYSLTPHSLYSLGDEAYRSAAAARPFGASGPAGSGFGRPCPVAAGRRPGAALAGEDAREAGAAESIEPRWAVRGGRLGAVADAAVGRTPPLSVHFMESPAERQLYRKEGELWQWYARSGLTADFTGYGSPAQRLAVCTPPGRDILLVHGTFVEEEDIDRVQAHFTGRVTWVLCPGSNAYITGAAPPVGLLRRKGVRLALGTDSLASNDFLDLAREMCRLPGVPLPELLDWATCGGAEGLGIDDRFGSIEPGRRCGLAVLEGADLRRMAPAEGMRFRRLV